MLCPLCNSTKTHFFVQKKQFKFQRCFNCKTIFLPSHPSHKELNVYYTKQFSYIDGLKNETLLRNRSKIILKKIHQIAPTAKTLCDVGCGYGFFLDEARSAGYTVQGIEPSRKLTSNAKKILNIPIFRGELKEYLQVKPNQFDVVTCIHVIEHVSNPSQFIFQLSQLVKPGGILFIETPNSDSHLLYVEKENYTFLIPPDHLWLLSKDSIKYILPQNMYIAHVNTYSYSEHFMGILKQIIKRKKKADVDTSSQTMNVAEKKKTSIKNNISFLLLDRFIAPLFTGLLNLYHKGSILELYIKKKEGKSGL